MAPEIKTAEKERNDMDFLKEILGEELFEQVAEKINSYNGNEANRDKQVKLENINSGNYVSKLKYDDISQQLAGKDAEIVNANNLIAELKKASKGDEGMQQKFTEYEAENAKLQAELQETKIKSAIKVALLSEKAVDVDYLTFKLNEKLKEKGETLELDENENIKGWDDKLSGLKTQFPTMFESANGANKRVLGDNRLNEGDNSAQEITKEQFDKMGYKSRVELRESNPELYTKLAN